MINVILKNLVDYTYLQIALNAMMLKRNVGLHYDNSTIISINIITFDDVITKTRYIRS